MTIADFLEYYDELCRVAENMNRQWKKVNYGS